MESRYHPAKNVFIDSIDIDDYIQLDSSIHAYDQLLHSIEKPLKMILVFGRPGTGKSILLNHLYQKQKHRKDIHYFETPMTSEKEFYQKLFKVISGKELPPNTQVNFSTLVEYARTLRGKREIIILLDEAQMYSQDMMERIRLLSDTRAIKFVVSLHKTDNEDLIAKEHFQSRIWEVVELKNGTPSDMQNYIHKKLLNHNLFEIANVIQKSHIKLIYKLTGGNYRETNKLMFTIFELYEYYDKNDPSKINHNQFSPKIIEMAGIKLGFIDV
jgi:replication-associated recombination protein RarA